MPSVSSSSQLETEDLAESSSFETNTAKFSERPGEEAST